MSEGGVDSRSPQELATLLARIRELARACGFTDAGVAAPDLPQAEDGLFGWLEAGYGAGMDWIGRSKDIRVDLRKRFSWARSVIVVTYSYRPQPQPAGGGPGLTPFISAYARGLDYHDILLPKLEELAASLADELDASDLQTQAYVDTGPVLERQLAQQAGLGWLGKNGLLLTPAGGSYVFLGVLITDQELLSRKRRRSPRNVGSCGSCDACQPACPTDAFVEPGVLDSRRCISYLTIEHRGAIDRGLRRAMGGWLFGCDLCQTACPINRPTDGSYGESVWAFDQDNINPMSEQDKTDPAFDPSEAVSATELVDLLGLSDQGFRERFKDTPLWRSKREGLLRNALIVAANLERHECLSAARELLRDPSPILREAASWMLAELHDTSALTALREAVESEDEEWVRPLMAQDLIRLLPRASSAQRAPSAAARNHRDFG